MIREFCTILALTLMVALTIFAVTPGKKADEKAGLAAVYKLFNSGNVLFLDARPSEQYAEGHIPGAINLPIQEDRGMELLFKLEDMLQSSPELVVYCTGIGCDLSDMLAKKMLEIGIPEEKIIVFKGGITQWKQSAYPVSTDTDFQKSLEQ